MRRYNAYALMPFDTPYDFVYESIRNAVATFCRSHEVDLHVDRADDYLETKRSKVQEIRDRIRHADFLILDLSSRSANVLWELGFAQCLNKHLIVLDSGPPASPFNVAETDKIPYTLSRRGLAELEDKLQRAFLGTIDALNADATTLLEDPEIKRHWADLETCLRSTPSSSVTHKLVSNELERITRRVTSIRTSSFELRNLKPAKEITDYYCDYLSQLEGPTSSFSTVTCCDFWIAISEGNRNSKYLAANKRALENGARISRVFVLSQEGFEHANRTCNHLMSQVLLEHLRWLETFGSESLEVGVIPVADRDEEHTSYPNIGLLHRKDETLFFHPQYDQEGTMEKTIFYYAPPGGMKREIRTGLEDFALARRLAVPLREFNAPWFGAAQRTSKAG